MNTFNSRFNQPVEGVYRCEMKKFACFFLLCCLSFGMFGATGLMESDSSSVAAYRVHLGEFIPNEGVVINRFVFHDQGLEGDCDCGNYTVVEIDSLSSRNDMDAFIDKLLYEFGVFPDLIEAAYISDTEYLKRRFSERPVFKAEVLFKGEPLPMVSWKEFPNLKTSGVFRTSDSTLAPHRRGFMFSPDIYNFTDKNVKNVGPKVFRAIKYDLEERLRYDMPLNGNASNMINQTDYITATDLDFIEDSERGQVAYFNGNSSYLDIRSDEEQLEEISIATWIKPETVEGSQSLVGKGEVFSAKIYNGKLQFTSIGIKDHVTTEAVVQKGEWSHVAMVYVPRKTLYFYLNGELIEEIPASTLQHADYAMMVGTNLWGQNYSGLLSDLNIWKRALSDEEVKQVYSNPSRISKSGLPLFSWLGILASGSLMIVGLFHFRKRKVLGFTSSVKPVKSAIAKPIGLYRNRINLLDGFKAWNTGGEDITHRFSPKRKELMVLIILETLKNGGISSMELSDILWPGFSTQNKKNNRSTQIKEIRNILSNELGAEIVFKNRKWQFELDRGLQVDLFELDELIPNLFTGIRIGPISADIAVKVAQIVSNGTLLPWVEQEWLDTVKASYNSKVLDVLSPYLEDNAIETLDLEDIIEAILVVDPLFEDAIKKKVERLIKEGKYGSAKKVVENYKKLYHSYYNQDIDIKYLESV